MIPFGLFDLKLLFVCQIFHVNCETENLFKKYLIELIQSNFNPFECPPTISIKIIPTDYVPKIYDVVISVFISVLANEI